MSVEIEWLGVSTAKQPDRKLCTVCRRTLTVQPVTPAEIQPHCQSKGCRWCVECHGGAGGHV